MSVAHVTVTVLFFFSVSCTESYFLAELLYAPEDDLVNKVLLTLHVFTLKPETLASANVVSNDLSADQPGDCKEYAVNQLAVVELINHSGDECRSKTIPITSLCSAGNLKSVFNDHQSDSYILDIDLDFFSTGNPFLGMYTKEEYSSIQKLYAYKRPTDNTLEVSLSATAVTCFIF